MQLLWVDLTIIVLIGLSVLTGLFRGFVKELIALCVWVLAIWLAYHYAANLDPLLMSYIHDKNLRFGVAFIAILFASLIIGGIVNSLLGFIMRRSGLSGTDRALGMGFGFIRGVFIVSLLMLAVKMTSLPYQEYVKQSALYAQFDPMVAWLYARVPQWFNQVKKIELSENSIDKVPLRLKEAL